MKFAALIVAAIALSACGGRTVQMMQADCQSARPGASYKQEWACIQTELAQSQRHQSPQLAHWTAQYRVFGNLLSEAVDKGLADNTFAKILILQFANQIDRDIASRQAASAASMQALNQSLQANRPLNCSTYFYGNTAQTNCN
jgi:hypothetical protein